MVENRLDKVTHVPLLNFVGMLITVFDLAQV